jgi:hypothetical protein
MARFTHKKSQWESLEKNIGQGRCFGARAASGKEVSAMEITVPLSHFVAYLNEVKGKGRNLATPKSKGLATGKFPL